MASTHIVEAGPIVEALQAESASCQGVRPGEILRKALHMFPGLVPFLFALSPHPKPLPEDSLELVAIVTAVLTGIFIAFKKIVRRPGESNFYSTCLSYPACVLATLVMFPQHAEFACVVVVVLAFGDGSAYIGGKLFGGRRLPWNPNKTWAGTLTFVAVAAPVAIYAYWLEANILSVASWGTGGPASVPVAMAVLCGGLTTLAAALAESWRTNITDNLRVGVVASISIIAAHYLFAGLFLA